MYLSATLGATNVKTLSKRVWHTQKSRRNRRKSISGLICSLITRILLPQRSNRGGVRNLERLLAMLGIHCWCFRLGIIRYRLLGKCFPLKVELLVTIIGCLKDQEFLFRPLLRGEELYTQMVFFVQSILADRYIHRRELRLVSLESSSSVKYGIKKIFF